MGTTFHDRVHYEVEGRVARITLDRPERLNAFDGLMYNAVNEALAAFAGDDSAWAAVICATGGRAFSAGADVGALDENAAKGITSGLGGLTIDSEMVTDKPIIAAVEGYCVGEGVNLVLGCDLVFAHVSARFMISEVRIGVNPVDIPLKLARRMPYGQAFRFLAPGDDLPLEMLQAYGFVTEIVEGDVLAAATAFATRLVSECAPLALRAQKATLWQASFADEDTARETGNTRRTMVRQSGDYAEGRLAFREKRPPAFTGQ